MGNSTGTVSKASSDVFAKIAQNVAQKFTTSCSMVADINQSYDSSGSFSLLSVGNTDIKQTVKLIQKCNFNTQAVKQMQQDLAASLAQSSKATGDSLTSGLSKVSSETLAAIRNDISQNLSVDNINKTMLKLQAQQRIDRRNSTTLLNFGSTTVDQSAVTISDAIVAIMDTSGNVTKARAEIKQKTETEAKGPLDAVAGMVSSALSAYMYVIFAVCVVIAIGLGATAWLGKAVVTSDAANTLATRVPIGGPVGVLAGI